MKKSLLIAAATLAVGVISSQAGVYSQNVVGYANVPLNNGGTYLLSCPFTVGSSNGANEIWPLVSGTPSIPDGSTLEIWTGSKFVSYLSDSGSSSLWDDNNGTPIPNSPVLPVGQGFFLIPAGTVTSTFAGAVAVNVGTSNKVTLANGGTYLIAPAVPYAGAITNGNPATGAGGANLTSLAGLPDGSTLEIWNGSTFVSYLSDSGSGSYWDDNNGTPIPAPPSVNVAQGFFLIPAANFTWTVGL